MADGQIPNITAAHCPVVVEYLCDPGQEYVNTSGVHCGPCLTYYNKQAWARGDLMVWRAPTNSRVLGFGDGKVSPPVSDDPIGITNVWLHVHKEVFVNYFLLGSPPRRMPILRGDLLVCGGRYTWVDHVQGTMELCPEWTCGRVTRDAGADRWIKSGQKMLCPRCYYILERK